MARQSSSQVKLGCVPYINALPLTYFLDPKEFEIITRPPAQLLELLEKGRVEAALLPIVNYFERNDLHLIPELAIAARGPVRSVKLFFKNGSQTLEKVKSIALDSESKTSNLLLQALLQHRFGRDLAEISFLSDAEESQVEAKLLIGDKALDRDPSPSPQPSPSMEREYRRSLDLGELWWEWTNKPFVFAAWMTRSPQNRDLPASLLTARERGLAEIETIIRTLPRYPADFLKEYFTRSVHYYMGPKELEGIKTFYNYLKPIQGYQDELHFRFVS